MNNTKQVRRYQSLKDMTEDEKKQRVKDQRKASYDRVRGERLEYHKQYYRRLKELAAIGEKLMV